MEIPKMSFNKRLAEPFTSNFSDFTNPWNFFGLFGSADEDRIWQWLRDHHLIADLVRCEVCGKPCSLEDKQDRVSGKVWRCRQRQHQDYPAHDRSYTVTKHSFFKWTHFNIRDILLFMYMWLMHPSLKQVSNMSGIGYSVSSVNWANYMRDICRQFVHDLYYENTEMLEGEIELDESFFGRRCKFNRGNPNPGHKVWIFGMIERSTNRLILYPVDHRDEETLIKLIQRHVKPGSRIFSDGWSAYASLNQRGYEHFTVIHKYAFQKKYRNTRTGEVITVHTNRIEGAWRHAKDHFKRINGTSMNNFEAHLAEIIWRNRVAKKNIVNEFFQLVQRYFPLDGPHRLACRDPLFDSWMAGRQVGEDGDHNDSVIRCEEEAESLPHADLADVEPQADMAAAPPAPSDNVAAAPAPAPSDNMAAAPPAPSDNVAAAFQVAHDNVHAASPPAPLLTSTPKSAGSTSSASTASSESHAHVRPPCPKKPRYQSKARCPPSFEPVEDESSPHGRRSKKARVAKNLYSPSNFIWDNDHDDDFEV